MTALRALTTVLVPLALVAAIVIVGILAITQPASALPPAGAETLNVSGEVSVTSRLGSETIPLSGSIHVDRGDPLIDGDTGVEVEAAEITSIDLSGDSLTGPLTVSQNTEFASTGEIRSLQEPPTQFPADSFFDIFVMATIPASPQGTRSVHNEDPIRIVPMENDSVVPIDEWPPVGVTYASQLDSCLPLLPELPADICVNEVSFTIGAVKTPTPSPTPCPTDQCTPTPTLTPTNTPCPIEVCPNTPTNTTVPPTPTYTPTPPPIPENPSFSVGRGGPSSFHPADILGLGEAVPSPQGNDDFANAFLIDRFPFTGSQSTLGATIEDGENLNPAGCLIFEPNQKGATVWYMFTAPTAGTANFSTEGSDFDTVLALYTGTSVDSLAVLGCDDDSGPGTLSEMSLPVQSGATYYLQAGGFGGRAGNLVLTVDFIANAGEEAPGSSSFIPCQNLGLSNDGCDNGLDGDQDNIDAFSYGNDFQEGDSFLAFSVAPGSRGLTGTGVRAQANCSPAQPQADEFATNADGTNELFFDGDGLADACPTSYALGLIELPSSDDLDALNGQPPSEVDELSDGTLDHNVFFSLDAASPSLGTLHRGPADILYTSGGQPGLYASAETLGLQPGDDIDALCVSDIGVGPSYNPEFDTILFSLTADSPTLEDIGANGASILQPGPRVRFESGQLGLRVQDDLDAMKCYHKADPQVENVQVGDIYYCGPAYSGQVCETVVQAGTTVQWDFGPAQIGHTVTECGAECVPGEPPASPLFDSGVLTGPATFDFTFDTPGTYLYYCQIHPTMQLGRIVVLALGDTNCNGDVNAIDAALVLQLVAGLVGNLQCQANADANGDGVVNAIDAAIILQYNAGLLTQLPP